MNIIRKSLIPIIYRYRGSQQIEYHHYLKNNQWNSLEANLEAQREQLYNIVKYAFSEIPYYKKLKIDFRDFKSNTIIEDIKRLPFLTKEELRRWFDQLFLRKISY